MYTFMLILASAVVLVFFKELALWLEHRIDVTEDHGKLLGFS